MQPFEALVVGLHLRWRGVWQRPNHLLTRFAVHVPILVVEEPVPDVHQWNEFETTGRITILRPHRTDIRDSVDDATCSAVRDWLHGMRPLIWLYSAQMMPLADAFPRAPLVYDKMDDLTRFQGADARIGEREPKLLERANVVFAGGHSLFETVRDRCVRGRCYPSGVDVAHFAMAAELEEHVALAGLRHPRAGYIGVIDERINLGLIANLARMRPDLTIIMVGPVAKIDAATLPIMPNIVYLGSMAYDDLPAILAGFDVAIMPFALNDATAAISPTKTLEYLAAGKGVASTSVRDVVRDYSEIVEFGDTVEAFAIAIDRALLPDPSFAQRIAARLSSATWDSIAGSMWADVLQATQAEPSKEVELHV